MRKLPLVRLVVLFVVLFAVGCSNNKGKIEGTKWTSQAATIKGQAVPAGMMQLEFKTDGTMTYTIMGQPLTGRYSLSSGDYVTLNMDKPLANSKTHREKVV